MLSIFFSNEVGWCKSDTGARYYPIKISSKNQFRKTRKIIIHLYRTYESEEKEEQKI
jgi:hypothetical protein